MSEFVKQRNAIKLCLRNGISVAETFRMLQKAFGDLIMSQKNVYKWHKDFKEGRERVRTWNARTTININWQATRQSNQRISARKSSIDNERRCWHYWHFKRITQHSFKRYCGQSTRGFCITIMRRPTLHSFFVTISPKTQRISFHNHHIRQIWLRVTFGYSPNSKDHSEDTVLTRFKRQEIQAESKKALKAIPEIEFNKCFDDWEKRWPKCIVSGGDYLEGDEIDLDK